MAKKRVHEIAKERGISSKEVLAKLQGAGFDVKAAASSVDERDIATAFDGGARRDAPAPGAPGDGTAAEASTGGGAAAATAAPEPSSEPAEAPAPPSEAPQNGGSGGGSGAGRAARPGRSGRLGEGGPGGGRRRRVVIDSQASRPRGAAPPPPQRPPRRGRRRRTPWVEPDFSQEPEEPQELPATSVHSGATVREVAESFGLPAPEVIKKLMAHGEMATLTQTLTDEAIITLADEFDKKVEIVHAAQEVPEEPAVEDPEEALSERPPVVTVMGHVDHGKTSLLDAIRETEVAAGEAGGITQHIGAYQVRHDGKPITFLDTPGHQAFTAMRARGASVTDVAVIVVAADDGVMPQTREAIDHARAAEVPIMIAVNKVDKEGADPNRVRGELATQGLSPADWGGDTEFVDVSAKTGDGLEDLLETVATLADIQELRANPDAEASGTVIESRLDPGRGPVVSLLILRGTLQVGDALVSGAHWGRVRAMHDYRGARVKQAVPGEPVEILGFDGVPEAGESVRVVENERRARQLAGERANRLKTEQIARRQGVRVSLEDVFARAQRGETKELNLVVKADVAGSLEALLDEIARLPQEQVSVNVIRDGVGGINESDIMLASASDAVVVGFNVRPVQDAARVADREGVEIRTYTVIYQAIEELRQAMEGLLEPEQVERAVGQAEVRQTFRASRVGTIAGCYVVSGTLRRGIAVRVVRDGTIVYDGRIGSLRRFQDDVREVESGYECGVVVEGFPDVKEGDVLEAYETESVERAL
ncbi:MAG TPA: translation initiation factor IF-2 [Thermoleophilaceae bacterium]|nr:translation initiation factor IF-2 [Thermoleophilaceae bacterium]